MNQKVTIVAFIVLISVSMLIVSAEDRACGEQEACREADPDGLFSEICQCTEGKKCISRDASNVIFYCKQS